MSERTNENASRERAGVTVAGGQAKATKQNRVLDCGLDHINETRRCIENQGLALRSTAGETQLATLPKVLAFLGPAGLNTYQGVGLGYLRLATRVKELKETWEIATLRETVLGPDGLVHINVARYFLIGKKQRVEDTPEVPA